MSITIPHAKLRQLQRHPNLTETVAEGLRGLHGFALSAERMEQLLATAPAHAPTPPKGAPATAFAHAPTPPKGTPATVFAHAATPPKGAPATAFAHAATSPKAAPPSATHSLHVTIRADLARPALQGVVDAIAAAAIDKLVQRGSKIASDNKAIDAGMREASERADAAMNAAVVGFWIGITQGLAQVSAAAAVFARGASPSPAPNLAARVRASLSWLLNGGDGRNVPPDVIRWVQTWPQFHWVRGFNPRDCLPFRNFAFLLARTEQSLALLLARLPVSPAVRVDVERLLRSLRRTEGHLDRYL